MKAFTVHFAFLGRSTSRTITVNARNGSHLADVLYRHIRKEHLLASRDIEVETYDDDTGEVYAGGRHVGSFTFKLAEAPA